MTVKGPTHADLFNPSRPSATTGRATMASDVREIQARLRQIGWFFGDVTDDYGGDTVER